MASKLRFQKLRNAYGIYRLSPHADVPSWIPCGEFTSVTRTSDELSIVCPCDCVPPKLHADPHWICLQLEGPFSFGETGILLSFISPLSGNKVPIFAVSTFDTDYVFIPEQNLDQALLFLQEAGHELITPEEVAK